MARGPVFERGEASDVLEQLIDAMIGLVDFCSTEVQSTVEIVLPMALDPESAERLSSAYRRAGWLAATYQPKRLRAEDIDGRDANTLVLRRVCGGYNSRDHLVRMLHGEITRQYFWNRFIGQSSVHVDLAVALEGAELEIVEQMVNELLRRGGFTGWDAFHMHQIDDTTVRYTQTRTKHHA